MSVVQWVYGTAYATGTEAYYNDAVYLAIVDAASTITITPDQDPTHWRPIYVAGPPGPVGPTGPAGPVGPSGGVGSEPTDGSALTPSLRTLGTGAQQAAAGNHGHPTYVSRLAEFPISVFEYGAVGDGVTDDTTAIQAALNTENVVYFPAPPVAYRITAALTTNFDQRLIGAGNRVAHIIQYTANTPIIIVQAGTKVQDLHLSYASPAAVTDTNSVAVQLFNAFVCSFERLLIRDVRDGIGIPSGNYMTSCYVSDIEIQGYSGYALNLSNDSGVSTGSVFNNIYTHNNPAGTRQDALGAANFGFMSDTVVNQFNVEHSRHSDPSVIINGCEDFFMAGTHVEGIEPVGDYGGLISIVASNVVMSTLDMVFCFWYGANIADTYGLFKIDNGSSLQIGVLVERNLNIDTPRFPLIFAAEELTVTPVYINVLNAYDLTAFLENSVAYPYRTLDFGGTQVTGQVAVALAGTAQVLTTGGTIPTAGVGVGRVAPAAAVTGVLLQAGTIGGQKVTVINEAAFSVTFAAVGTSHVADGVANVIAALTARTFVWDSGTARWYRES